jgi:hypothetical protein
MLGLLFSLLLSSTVAVPSSAGTVAGRTLMVGEGWGCVVAIVEKQGAWQCWKAAAPGPRPAAEAIAAWRVPWMDMRRSLQAGPDRLCTTEGDAVRCMLPPRRGETAPRPFAQPGTAPAADEPAARARENFDFENSGLYEDLVGGTFACPSKKNDIWCAGDNSYGQLGYSGNAAATPPLLKLWIVANVGLGTWHGCAWRDGGPPAYQGLFCWGRGDAGQLGFPAKEVCRVDGKDVACARKPTRVPFDLRLAGLGYAPNRGKGDMRGGDLFTCARDVRGSAKDGHGPGIVCWGASRDGLFGSASLCPSGLAKAWPTRRGGTIAAPAAACSTAPALIEGSDRFKAQRGPLFNGKPTRPLEVTDKFDIGPRGICMVSEAGEIWCKGAIATPRMLALESVVVSPGEDASACGVTKDSRLFCWGDGYSPANARDVAVPVVFEPTPKPPASEVPANGGAK